MARLLLLALLVGGCCPAKATARFTTTRAPCRGRTATRHRILHPQTRATLRQSGIDPDRLPCNSAVRWVPNLRRFSEEGAREVARRWGIELDDERLHEGARALLGYLVRVVFQELRPHNLGVMRLRGHHFIDAAGRRRPLLVFRSGVMVDGQRPGSCLRALVKQAWVRHVINLYGGRFPLHDLIETERRVVTALGATHHDERQVRRTWRELIKTKESYGANLDRASRRVAALIREQILRPGGRHPRGNIYFHCGGGMHRSGMIFGILRRCINSDPMSRIEAEYRRHAGGSEGGGAEELNLRFVRDFDCSLLRLERGGGANR